MLFPKTYALEDVMPRSEGMLQIQVSCIVSYLSFQTVLSCNVYTFFLQNQIDYVKYYFSPTLKKFYQEM